MEFTVRIQDETLTEVALTGSLDVDGTSQVEVEFLARTGARGKPTLLDMEAVDSISSIGVGMLVRCAKMLREAGAPLVLLTPQPLVASVLKTTRIDEIMPIADTPQQARQLLGCD